MNHQKTPKEIYLQNSQILEACLKALLKKKTALGWLRLILVLVLIVVIYFAFVQSISAGITATLVAIIIFLAIISIDEKNNNAIKQNERLLFINKEELSIFDFKYYHRENGAEYLLVDHPYASDLDLFGPASLFQYINRCTSEQGKKALSNSLLYTSNPETIINRQAAIIKLSNEVKWQQEFIAAGMENPVSFSTENKLKKWQKETMPLEWKGWPIFLWVYSFISIGILSAYFLDLIPTSIFSLLLLGFIIIAFGLSKKIHPVWVSLSGISNEISTIQKAIKLIETVPVSGSYLSALQQKLGKSNNASSNILQLKEILNRFDFRLNVLVFFFLNTFLLWDLRQLLALRKWKNINAEDVQNWFGVLTEMELLNSLSILAFNHPQWNFPIPEKEHFTLIATDAGHPLIKSEKRINNSFSINGKGKVGIITGSNMAGKSTFLRSIGVNLVLAQSGSKVCAQNFHFSPVQLYSSMRIADNLAENTSTFYAELKKLKAIIDEVNKGENVFILLDEILRGTNSLDRHTGSEALIKQFIKHDAVAVIATHDVELGNLQNDFPSAINNFHFDVQVEGEELYFDYKLKNGICQSMNASLLMKKIGIELKG